MFNLNSLYAQNKVIKNKNTKQTTNIKTGETTQPSIKLVPAPVKQKDTTDLPEQEVNSAEEDLKQSPLIEPEKKSGWSLPFRFAGYAFYTIGNQIQFNQGNINFGGSNFSYTDTIQTDNSFGLGAEIIRSNPDGFGFSTGFSYDWLRNVTGFPQKSQFSVRLGTPSLELWTLYANAIYRFDSLYIPFGGNYSFVNYSRPAGFSTSNTFEGTWGLQLGLGLYLGNHFSLETLARLNQLKGKDAYSNGTTVDYGTMQYMNYMFIGKFLF